MNTVHRLEPQRSLRSASAARASARYRRRGTIQDDETRRPDQMQPLETHIDAASTRHRPGPQPHAHAARGGPPRRAGRAAVLLPEGGVGAARRAAAPGHRVHRPQAVRIVTIDTGVLFPETLETWRAFEERFGVKIEVQDASSAGRSVERPRALLLGREGGGAGERARRRRGLDHGHPPRAGPHARRTPS